MEKSGLSIFSGSANIELAQRITKSIETELGAVTLRPFPDGETFVKINQNIRGCDVFIVQPTSPPTNEHVMELLIMIDAARRASAERITAVLPYYGYARQDRKDQPRVPITAKLVANLLTAAGADRVLTMDLHAQQIQGFFDIPVDHLYASPVFFKHFKSRNLENLIVVSPDIGSVKMASAYSEMLQAGLAIVAKRRKSAIDVEAAHLIGDVAGKNVLLIDDLTETGGTLVNAAKLLKENGAKQIIAAVSHAILTPLAIERFSNSVIDELIVTNTTPQKEVPGFKLTVLCVADLLGEAIKRIHYGESITSLFDPKRTMVPTTLPPESTKHA